MEEVILISASKTKTNKTILRVAYRDPKDKFVKGYLILESWLNSDKVYDELTEEDFGKVFLADFGYEDTYNGQARKVVKSLADEDGEILFQA